MAITISQKTKVSMTAILVHYVVNTKNEASIEETVDGDRYLFDSQHCITIFKKLANLYDQDESDINIMNLDVSSRIKASFLLVDRKFLLLVGLKDDTKRTSYEAIGV